MPGYDRSKLAQWARELGFVRDTLEKVLRLSDVLWKYWIFRRFGNGRKKNLERYKDVYIQVLAHKIERTKK